MTAINGSEESGELHSRTAEPVVRFGVDDVLQFIAATSRCLLWEAVVEECGGPYLDWRLEILDEEAAQRFLPLDLDGFASYHAAWYFSRPEEDRVRADEHGTAAVRAGRNYSHEFRCRRRDGDLRWLQEDVQVEPMAPGRWRAVGICIDVTERKRAEHALSISNERLSLLARVTGAVVGAAPLSEQLRDLADKVRAAFGVDAAVIRRLEGEDLHLLTSAGVPEDALAERLSASLGIGGEILARRGPVFIRDMRTHPVTAPVAGMLPADHRFVSYAGAPLLVEDGVVGILGIYAREQVRLFTEADLEHLQIVANHIAAAIVNDRLYREVRSQKNELEVQIAERRRAEEHQVRLVAILEATTDFVAIADLECRALYINRAGRRMTGLGDDADVTGVSLADLSPAWAGRIILREGVAAALSEGVWSGETALLAPDGIEIPVSQVILGHRAPDGTPEFLSTIARDITERHRLEAQLRQAQKMEAVGRLAGGVAHDFNNMLAVINGYSDLLLQMVEPASPLRTGLAEISRAGERAAGLTRQLLAYSRKQMLVPRVLDLNDTVAQTESLLRRVIGEDIEMVTRLDPDLGRVKADPSQIDQVLVNLTVNARDAMPDGGRITIETRNVDLDEEYTRRHPGSRIGSYVMVSVRDTGCGMDEETLAHLFEPFYTTKKQGKGTGLGLATVYGIVKQSDGYIEVASEPGRGSTFRVYLPRLAEAAAPAAPAETAPAVRGTGTILLVEDEPMVRGMVREVLTSGGYTVIEAMNGTEALRVCRDREGPIDLVLTDLVMPGMGGRELAEHLSAERPDTKVLFMSGYVDQPPAGSGAVLIQKPFTPAALAQKVRETLGRAG